MFKRMLVLGLCVGLFNLCFGTSAFAGTKGEKDAKFAAKVRSNIQKLGQGKDARVRVTLKNGTKLKGYVSHINEESFVVVDDATGAATEVPYPKPNRSKATISRTGHGSRSE